MDLAAVATAGSDPERAIRGFAHCLEALSRAPWPTLAVIDGVALAGGLGLAAARDVVLATERSTFGLPELLFGLLPAMVLPELLETLCRYLNYRLFDADVRINIVRSRSIRTASFDAHFGPEFGPFAQRFTRPHHFIEADEVANVVVALCSGDGVSGQVLTVDLGTTFSTT